MGMAKVGHEQQAENTGQQLAAGLGNYPAVHVQTAG